MFRDAPGFPGYFCKKVQNLTDHNDAERGGPPQSFSMLKNPENPEQPQKSSFLSRIRNPDQPAKPEKTRISFGPRPVETQHIEESTQDMVSPKSGTRPDLCLQRSLLRTLRLSPRVPGQPTPCPRRPIRPSSACTGHLHQALGPVARGETCLPLAPTCSRLSYPKVEKREVCTMLGRKCPGSA